MLKFYKNTLEGLLRFLRAEDGVIAVKAAFMIVPLLGMLGIGVDLSRIYLYRSQLSTALDAAALAGGKSFHSITRDQEIRAYFNSNFDSSYMGGATGDIVITEVDAALKTLTVSASGKIPTTFMAIFGQNNVTINVTAETTSKTTGLQLVMVLDNTGSMRQSAGSDSRINALKSASTTLVNSLFGNDASSNGLSISIVPYVTTVNVGHLLDSAYVADRDIDGVKIPSIYTYDANDLNKWNGCVEARVTNSALDSTAYDVEVEHDGVDWAPFLWRPHYDNHFYSIEDPLAPNDPTKSILGPNGEKWLVPNYQLAGGFGESTNDAGPNINCPAPVLGFVNDSATLINYIDNLYYSYNRGGTIANLGMIWGWRMLHTGSPFFNTVAYDDPLMAKAVILMTDGENWIINGKESSGAHGYYDGRDRFSDNSDSYDDDGDGRCPRCAIRAYDDNDEEVGPNLFDATNGPDIGEYYRGDYSGYGRRDLGRLEGATTQATTTTAINKRLAYVCSAMKGMGIIVYTVTFGSGATDTTLQNLYEGCATDTGKYFHAPSSAELEGAFEAIANDLSNLRLSK